MHAARIAVVALAAALVVGPATAAEAVPRGMKASKPTVARTWKKPAVRTAATAATPPLTPCTVQVQPGDTIRSITLRTWPGREDMVRRVAAVMGMTPTTKPRVGSAVMVCNFPPGY